MYVYYVCTPHNIVNEQVAADSYTNHQEHIL